MGPGDDLSYWAQILSLNTKHTMLNFFLDNLWEFLPLLTGQWREIERWAMVHSTNKESQESVLWSLHWPMPTWDILLTTKHPVQCKTFYHKMTMSNVKVKNCSRQRWLKINKCSERVYFQLDAATLITSLLTELLTWYMQCHLTELLSWSGDKYHFKGHLVVSQLQWLNDKWEVSCGKLIGEDFSPVFK